MLVYRDAWLSSNQTARVSTLSLHAEVHVAFCHGTSGTELRRSPADRAANATPAGRCAGVMRQAARCRQLASLLAMS